MKVTYEQARDVMQLYIMQGEDDAEMRRRAAIMKLEAATIEAAFKLLDKLGLKSDGHDLADVAPELLDQMGDVVLKEAKDEAG